MDLKEFATIQGLTSEQASTLEDAANKLAKAEVIATPDQLYQALIADNATLSVQQAAVVAGLSAHTIRRLGKAGRFQIDGSGKIHRIEYKSFLNFLRKENK